jgi:hypothetical protein
MLSCRVLACACLLFCLPAAAQPKVSPADLGPAGTETVLFKLSSDQGVRNKPTQKTVFTLSSPARIARICTYHWNSGQGKPGGTLGLKSADGTTHGPWPVGTVQTAGGAPVYWVAKPDLVLPRGTYEVLDSDPDTWSTNGEMRNMGCAWVIGSPAPAEEKRPASGPLKTELMSAVQTFRLEAIPAPIASLKKYSTPPALQELTAIENDLFPETPPNVGWKYFFATATYSVLPQAGQTAVVLFYHPWSDTGLLTYWQPEGKAFKMNSAELILGDCLRQSGQTPFELQPQWEYESASITPLLSIQLEVGETLVAFEKLFSGSGKAENNPALVKQRNAFDQSRKSAEVRKGVLAAAGLRFEKCVTALVRYEQDKPFETYRESTTLLLASFRNEDFGGLKATLPQTSQETYNLVKANSSEIARFNVASVLRTPKDCFVFLSHPADPNNVLALWFQTDQGRCGLRQANFINHVFSASYLDQIKDLVAKGSEK